METSTFETARLIFSIEGKQHTVVIKDGRLYTRTQPKELSILDDSNVVSTPYREKTFLQGTFSMGPEFELLFADPSSVKAVLEFGNQRIKLTVFTEIYSSTTGVMVAQDEE